MCTVLAYKSASKPSVIVKNLALGDRQTLKTYISAVVLDTLTTLKWSKWFNNTTRH